MGFLVPDDAAVLRGPMISKALSQLLRSTHWGELDALFVDMPPGTGDIAISLAQAAPLTGAVLVTTPQEVAVSDARKCGQMFQKLGVPLLGVIENMHAFTDSAGVRHAPFGEGGGEALARAFGVPLLGQIPLLPALCAAMDSGRAEDVSIHTYLHMARALIGSAG
jgi:ATP-binding protein involved in chromosome partitioning